ncbi:MAG: CpaF family protein [Actinomycetia bacterium]|nr:CpaF family protein [Actinomycetes bacterium]
MPVADEVDTYERLRLAVLDELRALSTDLDDDEAVAAAVRRQVDQYQAGCVDPGTRPLARPDHMAERLGRSVLAYGPLTPFVDGTVGYEELMIHGTEVTWIDEGGRLCSLDEPVSEAEVVHVVGKLLAEVGLSVDESRPIVQAQILGGRGRLGVVVPPIADAIDVTLRRYIVRRETLDQLVADEMLSPPAAGLLMAVLRTPTGVLVTGPPGSGKTTLLNAMLRAAPPPLRVIACEETPELSVGHLNGARWRTRPAGPDGRNQIDLRALVRMALGMRPDLIVVGEVRGAEAYELTRAGNAGCGLLSTVHANGAREGLQALQSTAVMAGANVSDRQVRSVFSNVIDLVVHVSRQPAAVVGNHPPRRQVMEISAVQPLPARADDFVVEPLFLRPEFGGPLRWTGNPLPPGLATRLEQILRPVGVSVTELLEGWKGL